MDDAEDVLARAREWKAAGAGVALATVVRTWGSSPRPAGSQLAVHEDGHFLGSVSGGCVESAVVQAGLDVLGSGEPQLLSFGVADDVAWGVGLPCGGKVEVHVARLEALDLLDRLLEARRQKRPVVQVTPVPTGEPRLLFPAEARPDDVDEALFEAAREAARSDESRRHEAAGGELFLHVHNPPLRMIVVGGVHLAQALCRLAAMAGFEVTLVDPRTAFASAERFPDVTRIHDWPDVAMEALSPDPRTAVVTLSHDAKLDEPALTAALRARPFYIGALGSRRTQAARRERLRAAGFGDADLARIHGPVGLPIGARTTVEIGIAIMAEVVEALRKPA